MVPPIFPEAPKAMGHACIMMLSPGPTLSPAREPSPGPELELELELQSTNLYKNLVYKNFNPSGKQSNSYFEGALKI